MPQARRAASGIAKEYATGKAEPSRTSGGEAASD